MVRVQGKRSQQEYGAMVVSLLVRRGLQPPLPVLGGSGLVAVESRAVGATVARLRTAIGMRQRDLRKLLGCPDWFVPSLEAGTRVTDEVERAALARALCVSDSDFAAMVEQAVVEIQGFPGRIAQEAQAAEHPMRWTGVTGAVVGDNYRALDYWEWAASRGVQMVGAVAKKHAPWSVSLGPTRPSALQLVERFGRVDVWMMSLSPAVLAEKLAVMLRAQPVAPFGVIADVGVGTTVAELAGLSGMCADAGVALFAAGSWLSVGQGITRQMWAEGAVRRGQPGGVHAG